MTKRWTRGDTIVERDIFFDSVAFARPLTVVSHDDDVCASYLPIGTRYFGAMPQSRETAYEEFGRGQMRWGENTWERNNALILVRPGDPYSVMGFWNEENAFVGWYINLQDPLRWTHLGYDTRDHTLDLVVGEDLASWMWKDEHELEMAADMHLYTQEEAAAFRRNGEAVIELVETGRTWWGGWRSFAPDPSWAIPELVDGWDVM